jgi:cupin superfamily protein
MILRDAHRILQRILSPMPLDQFLDETLGRHFIKLSDNGQNERVKLLGAEPERVILNAYREVAAHIGFHAAEPKGPPPSVEPVGDSAAFMAKIESFHALGYTVRIPQPRWLSPQLDEFLRSLEFFFHQPATAEAFWSRGDAKAPPHHDDYDLIAIQLMGRKRWFISTDPASLPNPWKSGPSPPPTLERHEVIEVGPGDLLYLPRGTDHRVDALADSLHLSIGFVPLTLRDAIGAVLDHLSELDRTFRETVGNRLSYSIRRNDFGNLVPRIRDGVARLTQICGSEEFVAQALQRRSSRSIGDLKKSGIPEHHAKISTATLVRHSPSAISHLMANREQIDFSHPGGHVYIHRGVELGARYVAETPEFRVRDVPGEIGDDVRIALIDKFLSSGFLVVVAE